MKFVTIVFFDIIFILGVALIGAALGAAIDSILPLPGGRSVFLIQTIFISVFLFIASTYHFRGKYPWAKLRWFSILLTIEALIIGLFIHFSAASLTESFSHNWLFVLNALFILPIIIGILLSQWLSKS